jgi:hypothetical protein
MKDAPDGADATRRNAIGDVAISFSHAEDVHPENCEKE